MTYHNHTNRPWFVYAPDGDTLGRRCILGPEDETICEPSFMGDGNANLIAAAPDLLAALEEIVALEDRGEINTIDTEAYMALHEAISRANAAIAKATRKA